MPVVPSLDWSCNLIISATKGCHRTHATGERDEPGHQEILLVKQGWEGNERLWKSSFLGQTPEQEGLGKAIQVPCHYVHIGEDRCQLLLIGHVTTRCYGSVATAQQCRRALIVQPQSCAVVTSCCSIACLYCAVASGKKTCVDGACAVI